MKPESGQEPWLYLALCVCLPPLGLYLLWRRGGLSLSLKLGVTCLLFLPVWALQSPQVMEGILKRRLQFSEQGLDWKSQAALSSELGMGEGFEALQYRLHGLSLQLAMDQDSSVLLGSEWQNWVAGLLPLNSEDHSFVSTLSGRRGPISKKVALVETEDRNRASLWTQFAYLILRTEPSRLQEHLPYLRQLQEKSGFLSEDRLGFWGMAGLIFAGKTQARWEKFLKTQAGLDDFRHEEKMVLARYYQLREEPEEATRLILEVLAHEPLHWDFPRWLAETFQEYEAFLKPYLQAERARFVEQDLKLSLDIAKELAQQEWPELLKALEQENLFNLAVLLRVQLQKPKEALPYLHRLLEFPHALREEEALFHRAMIYLGMGEDKKARRDIARLLNEHPATRYRGRIEVILLLGEIEDKLRSVWQQKQDGEA